MHPMPGLRSSRRRTPRLGCTRLHQYLGIGALLLPSRLISSAIDRAGELGAFDPDAASPLFAIKETHARVLLIHGQRDSSIPFGQSVALHAAAADHSRLFLLPNE